MRTLIRFLCVLVVCLWTSLSAADPDAGPGTKFNPSRFWLGLAAGF